MYIDVTKVTAQTAEVLRSMGNNRAAFCVCSMLARHDRGDFTPAKDEQDADDICFYLSLFQLKKLKALGLG